VDGDQSLEKLPEVFWLLPREHGGKSIKIAIFGNKDNIHEKRIASIFGPNIPPEINLFRVPMVKDGADLAIISQVGACDILCAPTTKFATISGDMIFQSLSVIAPTLGRSYDNIDYQLESLSIYIIIGQSMLPQNNLQLSDKGNVIIDRLRKFYKSVPEVKIALGVGVTRTISSLILGNKQNEFYSIIGRTPGKLRVSYYNGQAELERHHKATHQLLINLKISNDNILLCPTDCRFCQMFDPHNTGSFIQIPDFFFDEEIKTSERQFGKIYEYLKNTLERQGGLTSLIDIINNININWSEVKWELFFARNSVQYELDVVMYNLGGKHYLIDHRCKIFDNNIFFIYDTRNLDWNYSVFLNDAELRVLVNECTSQKFLVTRFPVRTDIKTFMPWLSYRRIENLRVTRSLRLMLSKGYNLCIEPPSKEDEEYSKLYASPTAKCYHRGTCTHVKFSSKTVPFSKIVNQEQFKPCAGCEPPRLR